MDCVNHRSKVPPPPRSKVDITKNRERYGITNCYFFPTHTMLTREKINDVEAKLVITGCCPKFVETVVILNEVWFLRTKLDDCANASCIELQTELVSFIRKKLKYVQTSSNRRYKWICLMKFCICLKLQCVYLEKKKLQQLKACTIVELLSELLLEELRKFHDFIKVRIMYGCIFRQRSHTTSNCSITISLSFFVK
ncbi:MAG: hypothetical protein EXX96DRAFT_612033 [Benjaminiella poitrasii]|nr:MAG: hypothetical protein EXX96DRAFT_612033 [Benjaminiella poitrasii]